MCIYVYRERERDVTMNNNNTNTHPRNNCAPRRAVGRAMLPSIRLAVFSQQLDMKFQDLDEDRVRYSVALKWVG